MLVGHDEAARIAQGILDLRQQRTKHLPAELFGESAWGILLVMFIADATGEQISADEACARAGGPLSVSRRWMSVLEAYRLVACRERCEDGQLVALTPEGLHAVEACMLDAQARMRP